MELYFRRNAPYGRVELTKKLQGCYLIRLKKAV